MSDDLRRCPIPLGDRRCSSGSGRESSAGAFTPVPGGVGPLTIAMLMVNTIQAAERHLCMIRAGLTGGMACGKSFVGRVFEELGCHVVRADELGREVLMPGGEAYQRRRRRISGRRFSTATGKIDRKKLAAEVFDRPGTACCS